MDKTQYTNLLKYFKPIFVRLDLQFPKQKQDTDSFSNTILLINNGLQISQTNIVVQHQGCGSENTHYFEKPDPDPN